MFDGNALRGFVNTLTVATQALTAEAAVAAMVQTAEAARARVLGGTPKPSGYRQIVDGVEGALLTAVRPDGVIVFAWQYIGEIVADTYGALISRAPRETGDYIAGILILADGVEVTGGIDALNAIAADVKIVQVVASVPYARRLEVGKKKDGSPFVVQVGPHIVEETAIVANQLYGSLADISFGYVDLTNAHVLTTKGRIRRHWIDGRGWYHQPTLRAETDVQYPAIVISPRQA